MTLPIVRQRLAIVAPSDVAHDSRARRLAASVAARGHEVVVVGRSAPGLPREERWGEHVRVVRVEGPWDRPAGRGRVLRRGPLRMLGVWLDARAQARAARSLALDAGVVHAMGFLGLPVARAVAGRAGAGGAGAGRRAAPVVYDARDIYAEARNIARLPGPLRALFRAIERRWGRSAGLVVTTNDGYAGVLAERLGRRPLVVMNGSLPYELPAPRPRRFHETLGLPAGTSVVLSHGGLVPERGLEQLVAAVPRVALEAVVILMGYGPLAAALEEQIAASGVGDRCHVLPAVPPGELLDWVASADVAVMPIQPTTLNHRLTTPNKLFEAMTAGVPVVAADLPGMAAIVRSTGCGVLCDPTDPAAIARAIGELLDRSPADRAAMGDRGRTAARDRYGWDAQVQPLLAAYGRLTGQPW